VKIKQKKYLIILLLLLITASVYGLIVSKENQVKEQTYCAQTDMAGRCLPEGTCLMANDMVGPCAKN
jgi:hypothetical protein